MAVAEVVVECTIFPGNIDADNVINFGRCCLPQMLGRAVTATRNSTVIRLVMMVGECNQRGRKDDEGDNKPDDTNVRAAPNAGIEVEPTPDNQNELALKMKDLEFNIEEEKRYDYLQI